MCGGLSSPDSLRRGPLLGRKVRAQRSPVDWLQQDDIGARLSGPGQVRFAVARHHDDPRANGGPGQQCSYEHISRNVGKSEVREHDVEHGVAIDRESRSATLGDDDLRAIADKKRRQCDARIRVVLDEEDPNSLEPVYARRRHCVHDAGWSLARWSSAGAATIPQHQKEHRERLLLSDGVVAVGGPLLT